VLARVSEDDLKKGEEFWGKKERIRGRIISKNNTQIINADHTYMLEI
jgi:hypothetical protein